jgi:hypothetical protein
VTKSVQQGYSGKSLSAKLGLRNGMKVALIGLPPEVLPLVSDVWSSLVEVPIAEAEYVHIFSVDGYVVKDLASVLRKQFTNSEVLWISWPKKTSGVVTDITEDRLREWILPTGLVDVKVCAVDATWSALKFVLRKELRTAR